MSNSESIVKHNGGNLVRMLKTLNGFKAKHGSWPTELLLHPTTISSLRGDHLTELGFNLLTSKVRIIPTDALNLISRDDSGRTFDYNSEDSPGDRPQEPAEVWLGFGLNFETVRRATETTLPEEVIGAVDAIVPAGVSHIGFVATNTAGEFLVTEPRGHPYGVSATFSKVKATAGERPSRTLARCLEQQVGQETSSVFPVPAVWVTPNSTGYYFAGLLRNEGTPPSETIPGLRWLPRERATREIRQSRNPTSRARDLGLIESVAGMSLSPTRRILLMVRELHLMGFERLRAPAFSSLSWWCPVVPVTWTYREHGGRFVGHHLRLEQLLGGAFLHYTYSSSSGQHPFGWDDVAFASPRELAKRFLQERRGIALAGWGPDREYARWFERMLEMTKPNGVISAFSDFSDNDRPRDYLYASMAPVLTVPLPPSGLASETEFDDFTRRFPG